MKLNKLKDFASKIMNKSKHKLIIDQEKYLENKDTVDKAITKEDVKQIIKSRVVKKKPDTGHSRGNARVLLEKKKLKRKRGPGKRKGTPKARNKTNVYNLRVRGLRKRLRELRDEDKLNGKNYNTIYRRIKGNYFKGKKHLEEYVNGENK
ncbi:MAG: 50S ribosomal protein L19e [Candidatus ainarchaeum sp.]|jgi:large subunit ribosomal protein L19e|nr:50S ribosomal protein L19e [Candidatus ainarchaeum sp.]